MTWYFSFIKMSKNFRFILGFLVGCLLSVYALFLGGAGHGTFAPMVGNASIFFFVPGLGIFLAVFGTPFLWAIYYALIPQFDWYWGRLTALISVGMLHLMMGAWSALTHYEFTRVLESHSSVVISYGLLLISGFVCLALISSVERNARQHN